MSVAASWSERITQWRQRARLQRRGLAKRLFLERWYPQIPIALAMAPLGLLEIAYAAEKALGVRLAALEIADLERHLADISHRPTVEVALGLSLTAMSVGLALRSRLAWLWSVGAMAVGLALQLPPDQVDVPLAFYFGGVLGLLLVHRRSFSSRNVVTSVAFAIVVLTAFLTWATLGTLRLGEEFAPPVRDLETAVYVAVVTVTGVGFGDIVATGPEARFFVVAMIVLGLVVGATALSAIVLPLIGGRLRELLGGRQTMNRSNHYVIVGKSPLARSAAIELEKRKQRVTLILSPAPEEEFYKQRDVVVGDATDLSVLRTAGAPAAKGVLALSTDDSTNGFVVLGINELDATMPTVAALNDSANLFRLKRTQPSMLLSLQALGGELLAMALTGERVDVNMLTEVLQVHGAAKDEQK
jgi:voltage-gated potassium channel